MEFKESVSTFNEYLERYRNKELEGNLLEPAKYILSIGGKRIRPALLLWINQLYKGDINEALSAALAIEMFHNFSLLHDDIMDEAPLRRGKTTVHEKWNTNTAILSGDAMLILVYKVLEDINPKHLRKTIKLLNSTALNVCNGQQLDMDFEEYTKIGIEQYVDMIGQKTGDLLGASFALGALLADADDSDIDKLFEFGKKMGVAFQIQDDILDLFGDKGKTGKQIGGDIIANKKTYLWIRAFEKADDEVLQKLVDMEAESDSKTKVSSALKLFAGLGVKEDAELEKNRLQKDALHLLKGIALGESDKNLIANFAMSLLSRED